MDARKCYISDFLNGSKQILVPLFQRPYEWKFPNWEVLWNDLLEQYEKQDNELSVQHFTGAIVTAPTRSVPIGVSKSLVIDGQQRLTTIIIIICAIRSLISKETLQYKRLTSLLINEYEEQLDYYKLLPTQPDREAFQALINYQHNDLKYKSSLFSEAYDYFIEKLKGKDSDNNDIDLEKMVEALKSRVISLSYI